MRKSTLRFAILVLLSISTISCAKESIEEEVNSYNHTAKEIANFDYSEIESNILDLVNEHRKSLELEPLQPITEISIEAESHNYYMLEVGKVSHDNFGVRYENLVETIGAKSVSENVGFGYHTAEAVVKAWLNSEGHKKNIEGNHSHFGVSVVDDVEGRNYFTNIFIRK
ncbi:CAP domain-containing protein [Salegentibacter salegens]|uniref:Cysteine-rich secretory protein family protein n=1 Tax=Salegentibacter salegens TaxID=143223 RepID=A0A1M7JKM3_9FLAO|nr:CAP domain-containing protein [Salegentibacter salegens]PRX51837.1 Cysteine-rich secretory protein family protein [Salegentibacter salegens]SHM53485.1 Cysteine-rich secretory protein family protein [Salegentibacter salegens]